jgi:hypothetical protein
MPIVDILAKGSPIAEPAKGFLFLEPCGQLSVDRSPRSRLAGAGRILRLLDGRDPRLIRGVVPRKPPRGYAPTLVGFGSLAAEEPLCQITFILSRHRLDPDPSQTGIGALLSLLSTGCLAAACSREAGEVHRAGYWHQVRSCSVPSRLQY